MSLNRYDRPTGTYTSAIPPGVTAIRKGVAQHFGITRTEVVRDRSRCAKKQSEHCECGAIDFFPPNLDQQLGRRVFDWFVQHGQALGIQSVIFDRRVVGFGDPRERAYTGEHDHRDHVHVGINRWGRTNVTAAIVSACLSGKPPSKEDQPAPVSGELGNWHRRFAGGVRWRLVAAGVEVEGVGVERTAGDPTTVTRVWETFREPITAAASRHKVPIPIIVATICTESSGKPDAVREEPGWESDAKTPHRISVGLMQTLISTAREATKEQGLDRKRLLDPATSINAGTAYIAQQRRATKLDPPVVAAAYNSGGVYEQKGVDNRWRMRQYPLGTGKHVDRFVKWFNDAVYMLERHPSRPEPLVDSDEPARPRSSRRPLREGDTGAEVAALQAWLNTNFPAYSKIDLGPGRYGPQTVKVIAEFQRRAGVKGPDANGRIVGPRTWAALERYGYRGGE